MCLSEKNLSKINISKNVVVYEIYRIIGSVRLYFDQVLSVSRLGIIATGCSGLNIYNYSYGSLFISKSIDETCKLACQLHSITSKGK